MGHISKLKSLRVLRLQPRKPVTEEQNPIFLELAKQLSTSIDVLEELSWDQRLGSFNKTAKRCGSEWTIQTLPSPWLASFSLQGNQSHTS
jgi:hypothetical protein